MDQGGSTDGWSVELLPGHGGADDRKDARSDDGADAQRGERPGSERLFESVLGIFRLADQLIDGLAGKELFKQCCSPDIVASLQALSENEPSPQFTCGDCPREHLPARREAGDEPRACWMESVEFRVSTRMRVTRNGAGPLRPSLALRLAASQFLDLLLLRSAGLCLFALGSSLLACRALYFFAFQLVFNLLCICHS